MKTNIVRRMIRAFRPLKPISPWPPMGDERQIAARYGRGNVLLQSGRILTSEEYEEQKRRVLSYPF